MNTIDEQTGSAIAWQKEISNKTFAKYLFNQLPPKYKDIGMRLWRDGWIEGQLGLIKRFKETT